MTTKLQELAEAWTSRLLGYPHRGGDQNWGGDTAVFQRAQNHQRTYMAGFKEGARMAWDAARTVRVDRDGDNDPLLCAGGYWTFNDWLKTVEE